MEYREAGRQPAAAAAAVEMSAGSEGEGWYDDVAAAAAADQGRSKEPPPLTHDDNRGFLRMLREKKERSDLSVVCGLSLLSYKSRKKNIYPCIIDLNCPCSRIMLHAWLCLCLCCELN